MENGNGNQEDIKFIDVEPSGQVFNKEQTINENPYVLNPNFWVQNLHWKNIFTIANKQYVDLIIDNKYLYIIKLPRSSGDAMGHYAGTVFGLAGVAVSLVVGKNNTDSQKRLNVRQSWLNEKDEISLHQIEKFIQLKVPLSEIKNTIEFGWVSIRIKYAGMDIKLEIDSNTAKDLKKILGLSI
jgi:hypothetical protein